MFSFLFNKWLIATPQDIHVGQKEAKILMVTFKNSVSPLRRSTHTPAAKKPVDFHHQCLPSKLKKWTISIKKELIQLNQAISKIHLWKSQSCWCSMLKAFISRPTLEVFWIELIAVQMSTIQSSPLAGVSKTESNSSSSKILGDQIGEKMVTSESPPHTVVSESVESTLSEFGQPLIDLSLNQLLLSNKE
mgnify:CR=1 FL=1